MFSLPKGTPKVHQVGLKNWQPAVASYQKGCKTTFLIEFAFAQQKIKNEPAHGLIIFFIIDTIATGSRSPAGPRRLGTATRISASLFRRLSAFFGSTPDQAPKAAKLAVLPPGHAEFPKRAERSEGSDTTPHPKHHLFRRVCPCVRFFERRRVCFPAFTRESKRGPFVREVEKQDEKRLGDKIYGSSFARFFSSAGVEGSQRTGKCMYIKA